MKVKMKNPPIGNQLTKTKFQLRNIVIQFMESVLISMKTIIRITSNIQRTLIVKVLSKIDVTRSHE
jgi:hypothetical protein